MGGKYQFHFEEKKSIEDKSTKWSFSTHIPFTWSKNDVFSFRESKEKEDEKHQKTGREPVLCTIEHINYLDFFFLRKVQITPLAQKIKAPWLTKKEIQIIIDFFEFYNDKGDNQVYKRNREYPTNNGMQKLPFTVIKYNNQIYLKIPQKIGGGNYSEVYTLHPFWVSEDGAGNKKLVVGCDEILKIKTAKSREDSEQLGYFASQSRATLKKIDPLYHQDSKVDSIGTKKNPSCLAALNPSSDPFPVRKFGTIEPRAEGVNLETYLKNPLTVTQRLEVAKALIQSLIEFRKFGLAHLDLAPKNMMYDGHKITFVDYDFNEVFKKPDLRKGSLQYIAPEMIAASFQFKEHKFPAMKTNEKADIYSMGITLCNLLYASSDDSKKTKEQFFKNYDNTKTYWEKALDFFGCGTHNNQIFKIYQLLQNNPFPVEHFKFHGDNKEGQIRALIKGMTAFNYNERSDDKDLKQSLNLFDQLSNKKLQSNKNYWKNFR